MPNHQLTPPFEHIPLGHEPQSPIAVDAPEVEQESHERLVERVREVVPDVLPAHVFKLLSIHETAFANNLLDLVIHILLEDRSYPKDLKGKAKARTAEEKTTEIPGDTDTDVDYLLLDANRHLGSTYRTLSMVCLFHLSSDRC
jgi:TRIAD3 protein (E3 ubiquitin-protein ligase RNF216)